VLTSALLEECVRFVAPPACLTAATLGHNHAAQGIVDAPSLTTRSQHYLVPMALPRCQGVIRIARCQDISEGPPPHHPVQHLVIICTNLTCKVRPCSTVSVKNPAHNKTTNKYGGCSNHTLLAGRGLAGAHPEFFLARGGGGYPEAIYFFYFKNCVTKITL
jgi:hypothetical protein